jgi:hypothetical protein
MRASASASETLQRLQQHQEAQRQQLAEDEARVTVANTLSQAHATWSEKLQAAKESSTAGAPGFTENVLKEFDSWQKTTVDNAPELGKKALEMRLAEFRAVMHDHAFNFEIGARHKKLEEDFNTGLAADQRTVIADPSQFNVLLANRLALGNSLQLPAERKATLAATAKTSLAFDAASGMITASPDEFVRLASDPEAAGSNPVISNLAPDKLLALKNHALALIAQRNSHANTLQDKAFKEAQTATEELRKFWISGGVPDLNYQNEVLAKVTGTVFEQGAREMLGQATAGAAHGAMSLPRQRANLAAMDAQFAKGSNPEGQKLLAYARQVTETQEAAYKENPWAASSRFARLPAVNDTPLPAPEAVPAYIKQVLPLMDGVEAAAGHPISPLQPQQALQLTQQLKALPVERRADLLGAIGEGLSAARAEALAAQLDKHDRPLALALKLGYGRTTLDRANAETMLRGAQALHDKTVKRDDMALSGWRSEISSMVRGTLGDAQAEQDAIDAAYYMRAGMDEPGYQGATSNRAAVKLAVGLPLDRGGAKTILPRGMEEDQFNDKLRAFTPERLRELAPTGEVYVRGQKRSLEQLFSALTTMGMRRNGAGQYAPVSGGAMITLDKDGQVPLLLEIR